MPGWVLLPIPTLPASYVMHGNLPITIDMQGSLSTPLTDRDSTRLCAPPAQAPIQSTCVHPRPPPSAHLVHHLIVGDEPCVRSTKPGASCAEATHEGKVKACRGGRGRRCEGNWAIHVALWPQYACRALDLIQGLQIQICL